jgi:hypothetical protein
MQLMPVAVLVFAIVLTSEAKESQCGRMQVVLLLVIVRRKGRVVSHVWLKYE